MRISVKGQTWRGRPRPRTRKGVPSEECRPHQPISPSAHQDPCARGKGSLSDQGEGTPTPNGQRLNAQRPNASTPQRPNAQGQYPNTPTPQHQSALRRRATTIVEALVATVVAASIMTATATLYGFVATRLMTDGTHSAVVAQANRLADSLTTVISQSRLCDTVTSGSVTALRCRIPSSGTDFNGDGLNDRFTPLYSDPNGTETYKTGNYVWFYMSSSAGTWGTAGTYFWRAKPTTNANPAGPDLDSNWALYYGGASRWNYIDSVTFTNDPAKQTTTFTISASSLNRAERSAAGLAAGASNSQVTITRTVRWRNARNLIVNPSFEYPAYSGSGDSQIEDDGLPGGWQTTGDLLDIHYGGNAYQAESGNQLLDVASNTTSGAQQTIITQAGHAYVIAFYYTPRPGVGDNSVDVYWDGNKIDTLNGTTSGWVLETYNVTASGTSAVIKFVDSSTPDAYSGLIDTVAVLED